MDERVGVQVHKQVVSKRVKQTGELINKSLHHVFTGGFENK